MNRKILFCLLTAYPFILEAPKNLRPQKKLPKATNKATHNFQRNYLECCNFFGSIALTILTLQLALWCDNNQKNIAVSHTKP